MRFYPSLDKLPEETNDQFCQRYADSIPPKALLNTIMYNMLRLEESRGPVWSQIGSLTGHGHGISSAIANKYMPLLEENIR